eukprot:TRINITY_DN11645_c0_g3_i1.p1 TRINITY_DN11645_c0_g3~~TRINITY_DN11645_c0_g3_i1.p1  ORF type:complete len:110 (+),score=7.53 TRINITY_DN11645_c0_g3_i1:375-704(+)
MVFALYESSGSSGDRRARLTSMHFLTELFSVKTTSLSRTAKEYRWLDPAFKRVSHPMWSTHYSISLVFLVKLTLGDRQDISPSRRFFLCLTEREMFNEDFRAAVSISKE